MQGIDYINQQLEIYKQSVKNKQKDFAEIKSQVSNNLVTKFLQDYRPFVKKFFGDMTVKTIRWDDETQKFVQKEHLCYEAHFEFLNTVDRFYHGEKYWESDPLEEWPNMRVWVERQDTIARLEGY
jgi:hypothetical protein